MKTWWKTQVAGITDTAKHFIIGSICYTAITLLGILIAILTGQPLISLTGFLYICGHGDGWETHEWYSLGVKWWFNNKFIDTLLDKFVESILSIIVLSIYWYDVIWGVLK